MTHPTRLLGAEYSVPLRPRLNKTQCTIICLANPFETDPIRRRIRFSEPNRETLLIAKRKQRNGDRNKPRLERIGWCTSAGFSGVNDECLIAGGIGKNDNPGAGDVCKLSTAFRYSQPPSPLLVSVSSGWSA